MKQLITAILCMSLLLALAACGGGSTADTTTGTSAPAQTLRVGYSKANITPH